MTTTSNDATDEDADNIIYFKENCNEIIFDEVDEDPEDDLIRYMCVMCNREFRSANDLYDHEESEFHNENLLKKGKNYFDLKKDESYVKAARKEEEDWISENLDPELGFGFPLGYESVEELYKPERKQKANRAVDEPASIWNANDSKDWECAEDDNDMREMRKKMHHPLGLLGRECGVPSDEEELEEAEGARYSSAGKEYRPRGRLVTIEKLDPVGKEEQVERGPGERVSRLPGGWCVFEEGTQGGRRIKQRVVLVTAYRDNEVASCCPQPRKK